MSARHFGFKQAVLVGSLAALAGAAALPANTSAAEAFGSPGAAPVRGPAAKSFLGTAVNGASRVDLPPTNRASRSLVKFVFGEEDEHEEALYGTANHRVSEGSRGR
ncbi:alkyl hydroperoxide reductase, partial [Burkholderia mallei]|uniref:alkyl hydroperoxide reductase n=5 Tax=Burkholderia mallei TaxID=13373 RepID=UPI0009C0F009